MELSPSSNSPRTAAAACLTVAGLTPSVLRPLRVAGFVAALALLTHSPALWNGFVYDDLPAIVTNSRVTDPSRWRLRRGVEAIPLGLRS